MSPNNLAPGSVEATNKELVVRAHTGRDLVERLPALTAFASAGPRVPLSRYPGWLTVLAESLGHTPFALEACHGQRTVGLMGLAYMRSLLFGRFLVSLPYLNYGGAVAEDERAAAALTDYAVSLADKLDVRYLELRHEWALEHAALSPGCVNKVHMRLELPITVSALWDQIPGKARNQIRKGQGNGFTVHWGRQDLLGEFYDVFSHNMRDLGTPVFSRRLFAVALEQFPNQAELCVVRHGARPVASALLLHGRAITEVPSASSLRSHNSTCVNMLMYWHLLERAVGRGQEVFDFGRCSEGSSTYRFKKQWGATSCPAEWQYHVRRGTVGEMRPESPRYRRLIRIWQSLPLWITRRAGPRIVRGIP